MRKDKEWLKKEINKVTSRIYGADFNTIKETDDLIDQLDEPQKPVIPKFVADWIDTHNLYGNNPLREYRCLEKDFNDGWTDEKDAEVYHWVNKSPYAFIDALRYGYEVEKKQKYILSINITDKVSNTNYETFLNKRGIFHSMENESFNSEEFNWTEEEIKDLENGEMLFEHFATKVEEVEE